MRTIRHFHRGAFNLRCLFGHAWGAWSKTFYRTRVSGGLLGDDFLWRQRKCDRCGAMQGEENPNADE